MITKKTIPVEPGFYYHIYNHSNGNDNIFFEEKNYHYFLLKYKEHISSIADTFAYCLMPNHFHFLLRFKEENELFELLKSKGKIQGNSLTPKGFRTLSGFENSNPFSLQISQQFSNFFNSYAQAINKQEKRIGSLFAHPFKRNLIKDDKQLRNTLIYIHSNPVHHGFTESAEHWQHSSYHALLNDKPTLLLRDEAISWFNDKENFIFCHKKYADVLIDEE